VTVESTHLTVSSVLAAASEILARAGYRRAPEAREGKWLFGPDPV